MEGEHGGGHTPTSLVTRAQQGHDDAFRSLYRALTPELTRYAAVIVGQDAEDVVAETWLQIARDILRFRGDDAAFRRFALTVTRNRARDLLRHRGRRVDEVLQPPHELPDPRTSPDTADVVAQHLGVEELLTRLTVLPTSQAEVVWLRVVLGLGARDTAEILGRSTGSVAMALSRGLKRLAGTWARPETERAMRR